MKKVTPIIFRAIMSALMVCGALALVMPLTGVVQPISVLLYTFVGVATLFTAYEMVLAPRS